MGAAGWGICAAAVTTLLVVLALSRRREMALVRALREIREGDLGARIDSGPAGTSHDLSLAFNLMAESLQDRVKDLQEDRGRLSRYLTSMGEGIVVVDVRQRITYFNSAAANLFGVPPERIRGMALWELVRDEPLLKAVTEAERRPGARVVNLRRPGDRHLTVKILSLMEGAGAQGMLMTVWDTTESARYQELRKEFVANVSHELRTPVTVIRGYVETLQDGALEDSEQSRKFLEIVARQAAHLAQLVEDLLDLSRLDSPQGLPRRLPVDLQTAIPGVVELHAPQAQKKGQSISVEVASNLPTVPGDPDYIERAVSNLLTNAVKYTPEGGKIGIRAYPENGGVVVQVQDNGPGIPEQDLPRIFERFYRVDRSRTRGMGGVGLGLAIVKHVAQAHGGSVEVASETGKGAIFRIRLPVNRG